jgi:Class II Aldolase and Adducin N-terminal domain
MLEQFSRFGRELFLQGVNSSHSGNMSVRAGDRIFITRRGSMFANLKEGGIIETGLRDDDSHITLACTEIKDPPRHLRPQPGSGRRAYPSNLRHSPLFRGGGDFADRHRRHLLFQVDTSHVGGADRRFRRGRGDASSPVRELQGGDGQGTRQLCCRADAGRGVSMDFQPGGIMQDAILASSACSSGEKGSGRDMVTLRDLSSRRLSASLLTARASTAAKASPEPIAAMTRKTPVLSANEASRNPATSNIVLLPFIFLCTFQSGLSVSKGMLAPGSDKSAAGRALDSRRRSLAGLGAGPRGVAAVEGSINE